MQSGFDPIHKNKLLLPMFVIGLLLCWFLAFNKTFDAIMLNRKLKEDAEKVNDISFNPAYVQKKITALNEILKSYKVGEDWNDKLWMQSSAFAAKQNLSVDFTLEKQSAEVDSSMVNETQSLYFYGDFLQLVKLVDTLERTRDIGKISGLLVKAPKTERVGDRSRKCVLRLNFKGIGKL